MELDNSENEQLKKLPASINAARSSIRAWMFSGFLFGPMLFFCAKEYIVLSMDVNLKKLFFIFTLMYFFIFNFITYKAQKASEKLRSNFEVKIPKDSAVVIEYVIKNKNKDNNTVVLAQKYWFWQLASNYFTGLTLAWLFGIFYIFMA